MQLDEKEKTTENADSMQFGSFSFPLNTPNNCLSGKFDDRNTGSAPSKKGSSMAAEVEDVVTCD
jgi:hypothetical protein